MKLNFRRRFTLVISAYSFILILISLSVLWLAFEKVEGNHDEYLDSRISADISLAISQTKGLSTVVEKRYFTLYTNLEVVPKAIREYSDFGLYHIDTDNQLVIGQYPESSQKYYLILHFNSAITFLDEELPDIVFLIASAITATVLIMLLVFLMAKKLTAPVIELQGRVKALDIDSDQLPLLQRDDEIGELSEHFSQLIRKMRLFAQRERDFSRFASHELRTPLTVMRGNLELLESGQNNNPIHQRALHRMDAAITRMQKLIEVFLWLGREQRAHTDYVNENIDQSSLESIIHQIVDNYQIERLDLTLELCDVNWQLNPQMLTVVLENLIGNVQKHAPGAFVIQAYPQSLEISNTVQNADPFTAGIGLKLVERVCQANHWVVNFEQCDQLFKVAIQFPCAENYRQG